MITYNSYLNWIDGRHDAMVQQVLDWSHINSGSLNIAGLDAMRAALVDAFAPLDGKTEEITLAPMREVDSAGNEVEVPLGKALRIVKRPDAPYRVLLSGHMDTVFAVDHPFQHTVRLDDNTLNGPGVADLKGGLAVMLSALEALERSPFADNVGWEVLLNSDEEIGSPGSAPLLAESARRSQIGLIYEPALADGTLAGARKGSGNFTAVVRGKAAHAGREHHLGRNAIVALADFICAIDAFNGQRPGVTVNPGRIEGGGALNIVPDLAIGRFNVRVADTDEMTWVERQLRRIGAEIHEREGFAFSLHGGFGRAPKALSPANLELFHCFAECGVELGVPVDWKPTGGCCDGNNLAAAGLPNIDTLGVRGGGIHSSDEFVLLDSLTERARLSALFLMKLGAGKLPLSRGITT
jgi:glutamate carboxypeptidase